MQICENVRRPTDGGGGGGDDDDDDDDKDHTPLFSKSHLRHMRRHTTIIMKWPITLSWNDKEML